MNIQIITPTPRVELGLAVETQSFAPARELAFTLHALAAAVERLSPKNATWIVSINVGSEHFGEVRVELFGSSARERKLAERTLEAARSALLVIGQAFAGLEQVK